MNSESAPPSHFKGKDAIGHVIEAQAQGIIAAAEIHGTEIPGHLAAGFEAARESALLLPLVLQLIVFLEVPFFQQGYLLALIAGSWLIWKMGRSAWLGWFRLERLHRILEQEHYEIVHHRQQERDELRVLYAAKGFEGKLLEEVLDVLMADNERLLKVMVQEELGLTLSTHEHPLKQGLGAGIGVLTCSFLCLIGWYLLPSYGLYLAGIIVSGLASFLLARLADNDVIPAVIWNVALLALAFSWSYFGLELFNRIFLG